MREVVSGHLTEVVSPRDVSLLVTQGKRHGRGCDQVMEVTDSAGQRDAVINWVRTLW